MKTTFVSREKNDVKFTLEFTAEEFDNAQIKVYQSMKDRFEIPGFRRGKAPRSIIEKHYGEGIFFEDAVDALLQAQYPAAVEELKLDIIDSPAVTFSQLKKGEGFTATITVACAPVVEVKDYKGVEIEKVSDEVTAEAVDNDIEGLRKRNARIVSVERPAQDGDTVVLDYSGFVGEEQFDGGTAEKQELKLGSGMFIPGFEEQLVGVAPGEKKDVTVTFPEEYHAEDLAGKEAVFHCLVHEVKEEQLPELDDEFAKDVSDFDTLEELKASTRERLETYAKQNAENQMKDAVLGKVVEATEVEIPPVMIEDEIDRMVQEMDQQLRYQGMGLEQYLSYLQKEMADFRAELKEEATRSVKTRLVLAGIVTAENITATGEEVEEELTNMGQQYQMTAEQVRSALGAGMRYLEQDIKNRKAVDLLYDSAVIA